MEKIFFYIIFLSKTTVNPLRKQNPYHGNSPQPLQDSFQNALKNSFLGLKVRKTTS